MTGAPWDNTARVLYFRCLIVAYEELRATVLANIGSLPMPMVKTGPEIASRYPA